MLGLGKKKGLSRPTEAFVHAEGCKVVVADPGFKPEWQEIEEGHWRRICQCYSEDIYEPRTDTRTRLDPMDPATFGHCGGCDQRDTTDPVVLRAILKVQEGAGGGYWWVQCGACDCGWQVPHFVEEAN